MRIARMHPPVYIVIRIRVKLLLALIQKKKKGARKEREEVAKDR